jgi:hypothetical protein
VSGSEVTEDHITVGDEPLYEFGNSVTDNPFTFVVGFKPDSATVPCHLVTKSDDNSVGHLEYAFMLYPDAGLEPRVHLYDDSTGNRLRLYGTPISNPTEKHQICLTYDGSAAAAGLKIYVDGLNHALSDESQGAYTAMHASDADLRFGSLFIDDEAYDQYADGVFEYVYIYNRALTASEIAHHYAEPFVVFKEDLSVAMMYDYAGAAPSGQVIFIQMSAIPVILILLAGSLLYINRKNAA